MTIGEVPVVGVVGKISRRDNNWREFDLRGEKMLSIALSASRQFLVSAATGLEAMISLNDVAGAKYQ